MPPIENRIGWVSNSVVKNKIEKKIKDDSNDSSSESRIESYTATRDRRKFIDTMNAKFEKRNAKRKALSPLVDGHLSSEEFIPKKKRGFTPLWKDNVWPSDQPITRKKHKEALFIDNANSIFDNLEVTGKIVLSIDLVTSEFILVNCCGEVVKGI
jgi:hypothetical protein